MVHNMFICSDDMTELQKYQIALQKIAKLNNILLKTYTYSNAQAMLSANPLPYVDLLLIDHRQGVEIITELRQAGSKAEVIIVLSDEEFISPFSEITPFCAIQRKQISPPKLQNLFLHICSQSEEKNFKLFSFKNNSVFQNIPLLDIAYFEIKGRIAVVHYNGKTAEFYTTMNRLESILESKGFVRTQRSYLVNIRFIEKIERNSVYLVTEEVLPLGTSVDMAALLSQL